MIDWPKVQRRLKVGADGIPGDGTYSALLNTIASRSASQVDILAMARALKTFAVPLADLSTPRRLANYIAQTGNETGGFTTFVEGLNYSAQRMAEVWPHRYAIDPKAARKAPNAKALKIAGNPRLFANDVYGARMGNEIDGTADDDGFDFRGAGPLQNTGYANFLAAEKLTGIPFSTQPVLMQHPGIGTIGCLAWWARSGINAYLDKGQSVAARSIANAGNPNVTHPEGIEQVTIYEARLLAVLM